MNIFARKRKGVGKEMKIVMLEKTSLGDDVNISALEQLGELVVYDTST